MRRFLDKVMLLTIQKRNIVAIRDILCGDDNEILTKIVDRTNNLHICRIKKLEMYHIVIEQTPEMLEYQAIERKKHALMN